MNFEPTGELLGDLNLCIENSNQVQIDYTDRKGNSSTRTISPLEIRGDGLYAWSMDKNALRLFKLKDIGSFTVLEDTFNKDEFHS